MHLGDREKFISVTETTVHRLRSVSKGKVRGAWRIERRRPAPIGGLETRD